MVNTDTSLHIAWLIIHRDAEPGTYLQDTNERTHVHDDHSTDIEKDAVNHTSDTLQECIDSGLLDLTHSSLGQTFSIDSGSSLDDDICCDEGSCSNATIFDDANSSLHHSGYSGTRSSEGCSCDDGTQSCFEHRFYDGTLSNFDCTFLHNASSSPSTSSYILNNDGAAGDSVSVFQWPSRGSATITDVPSGTIGETAGEILVYIILLSSSTPPSSSSSSSSPPQPPRYCCCCSSSNNNNNHN